MVTKRVGTWVFGGGDGGNVPLPLNHQKMWEGWDYNSSGAQICCRDVSKPAKTSYVAIGPPNNKKKNNIYYIRRYLTALASQPRCKNGQMSVCRNITYRVLRGAAAAWQSKFQLVFLWFISDVVSRDEAPLLVRLCVDSFAKRDNFFLPSSSHST